MQDVINQLTVVKDKLEEILAEEETAFDNLTEGLQCTNKGQTIENNVAVIEDAVDHLDEALSSLEEVE